MAKAKEERPLTPRQARVVEEYLKDLNATQSAARAGYSAKTAEQQGYRLLRNAQVAEAISGRMTERAEKVFFTQESILVELQALAKSNVTHYRMNEDTGELELTDIAPENAMAAVSSIKYRTRFDKDGGKTREVEFKLWDKPGTLKLAGRHVGVAGFFDKVEHTGKDGAPLIPDPVVAMSSDEQRREAARLIAEAQARIAEKGNSAEP